MRVDNLKRFLEKKVYVVRAEYGGGKLYWHNAEVVKSDDVVVGSYDEIFTSPSSGNYVFISYEPFVVKNYGEVNDKGYSKYIKAKKEKMRDVLRSITTTQAVEEIIDKMYDNKLISKKVKEGLYNMLYERKL